MWNIAYDKERSTVVDFKYYFQATFLWIKETSDKREGVRNESLTIF